MEALHSLKPVFICIDDEIIILKSLQSQLQRNFGSKYQYEFAESTDEAFELIEELIHDKSKIIVIISDWLMPQMKGDEFLIKVHEMHPNIVKIMLTGQADKSAIQRAVKEADLFRLINKPWEEKELIEIIHQGLLQLNDNKK